MPETGNADAQHIKVERSFRRGNVNFDFLSPVQPKRKDESDTAFERRTAQRIGKRGLFNRGRKVRAAPGWYTWLWLALTALSMAGLFAVWTSDFFLTLLAVPFLLSTTLVSLIMFGLFLARPR